MGGYIKNFTPKEFLDLDKSQLYKMIEDNIPFSVSNIKKLDCGFYFCYGTESLHDKEGKIVPFTNLEKKFIKLLIDSENSIVDYKTIQLVVWKGRDMSVYTLRNVINKIRQKTYYEIIKNISNHGYTFQNEEPEVNYYCNNSEEKYLNTADLFK